MTTDTFVSQELLAVERAKWLLRLLAEKDNEDADVRSGICDDATGSRCVYCDWSDEDYRAKPEHTKDCPIRKTREFLEG